VLTGTGVRERLVFEDSLVGSQHIVNASGIPEQACHVSVAFTPDRLILLASRGEYATATDLHARILHSLYYICHACVLNHWSSPTLHVY